MHIRLVKNVEITASYCPGVFVKIFTSFPSIFVNNWLMDLLVKLQNVSGDGDVGSASPGAGHTARQLRAGRRGGVLWPPAPPTQPHRRQGLLLDTGNVLVLDRLLNIKRNDETRAHKIYVDWYDVSVWHYWNFFKKFSKLVKSSKVKDLMKQPKGPWYICWPIS